jgi:hypothetical protein
MKKFIQVFNVISMTALSAYWMVKASECSGKESVWILIIAIVCLLYSAIGLWILLDEIPSDKERER